MVKRKAAIGFASGTSTILRTGPGVVLVVEKVKDYMQTFLSNQQNKPM